MEKKICLIVIILMLLVTSSTAYSADLGVQIIVEDNSIEKPIPFYVDSEIELRTVTNDLTEIFKQAPLREAIKVEVRTDEEALEYYMAEAKGFGAANYIVFSNDRNALIRKNRHMIVCNFVSSNSVKPSVILLDAFSQNDASSDYHEEYFFAFRDGFVFVDYISFKDYYSVMYFNPKTNSLTYFKAVSISASLDETLYVFTDAKGRIIYFDLRNSDCGILETHNGFLYTVYAGYCNYLLCLDKYRNYVFVDFNKKKAFLTSLPNNTIYVDEDIFVTNEEFSLKTHSDASTKILVKKADNYYLQDEDATYSQYGNILLIPGNTVYVFKNGSTEIVSKISGSGLFGYLNLDRVHRYSEHGDIYDKYSVGFRDFLPPKDFWRDYNLLLADWKLFCTSESFVFTPTTGLGNNFSVLQDMGYYVYHADSNTSKYVCVKFN